ncbi:hypothetical protein HPP92_023640 [Vanilla planifolia]|uniref:WRKY19-like zinc finger domain-containing protein n=1 Tax=Vanilla planifolia TaxID=51239 RepID=A0A835PQP0_VANPL|nr:hypothetical protein HPP92_023640 [Vanilla planifolia]
MDNRSKHLDDESSLNWLNTFLNYESDVESLADTTLRLVSPGSSAVHGFNMKGSKRKWEEINGVRSGPGASLSLAYRCSPSLSESSKRSSATVCTVSSANGVDEGCSVDLDLNFQLKLNAERSPFSTVLGTVSEAESSKSAISLQLSLSVGPPASAITRELVHMVGLEGSVSSCWNDHGSSPIRCGNLDLLPSTSRARKSQVVCTSGDDGKRFRISSTKNCQFLGCLKGARGASGFCIAHGGGRRCQKAGCVKGAEGKTIYCKAHGGGRRCEHLGCTKSAEGRTDKCIAHGGGRRCNEQGCGRAARGKSGLCIRHGGGKRCQRENCTKSAEGQSGLCIAHGGGRRCQHSECTKGAQGSTMFCKAHGGGKRCSFPDCRKGAEGSTAFCKGHGGGKRCLFGGGGLCPKSVHGGTQFCVAHGGGKRCADPGCTKSARGRTNHCVRHGGGRRCRFDGCGKSAQGSTNFCKAHGGGKRCLWGHGEFPCEKFARGKAGLCSAHSALVQDERVHGGDAMASDAVKMNELAVEGDRDPRTERFAHPPSLPEGRVHGGGSLMALLASGALLSNQSGNRTECDR